MRSFLYYTWKLRLLKLNMFCEDACASAEEKFIYVNKPVYVILAVYYFVFLPDILGVFFIKAENEEAVFM